MYRVLFLFLIISSLNAQNIFFNDPVVSGTPLIPSNDVFLKYFEELKKTDYHSFEKITSYNSLPENVGDEHDFNVANLENPNSPKLEKKTFVLKVASEKVDIWVEKAELENNHVTDAIITTIFNGLIYNTPSTSINPQKGIFEIESEVYGSPPDIDSNGKVEFLLTDIIDGWDGTGGFTGGFFYPNDQNVTFPGSNKADILYVDTYPGIYRDGRYDTYRALGTVAHELQHLIQYNYDKNESSWVNEGLSELASYLCGHGLRSPGLYLENTAVSLVSWNNSESLQHYSRVALFSYYLYEKYGLSFISKLSQTSQSSVNGFNAALSSEGLAMTFNDVLSGFFKTLISNTPEQNAEYAFDLPELQYLKIVPNLRISQYPLNREIVVNSYAMQSVKFTNGDSLVVHFEDLFKFPVYVNKTGFGGLSLLNEYNLDYIIDNNFGTNHHTQDLFFANSSGSSDVVKFKSDSHTKYDIAELKYDSGTLTYNISPFYSNFTSSAIIYVSPWDTALLKSIKFYNNSVLTDIRIHLYQSELSNGGNPASIFFDVKNVTLNEWVSIDTEDFLYMRDAGETFNVGIEFLTNAAGVIGYENVSGTDHTNKSFVKDFTRANNFYTLNQYTIGGESMDGTWMIRLELATPFTGKSIEVDTRIESLLAYPSPFSPLHNSGFLNIEYELDNLGPVRLKIFNILGQLVSSDYDDLGAGRFYWDGKNHSGQYVASGFYVLQLSSNKSSRYQRLLLIR